MPAPRKFEAGQRVWKFDPNCRVYGEGRHGGPIYEKHYREFKVLGIEGRSYRIAWVNTGGHSHTGDLIGFTKAEREFFSDREKDDAVYRETHRNRLSDLVRKADAATLRRVAEILEGEGPDVPDRRP